MSLLVVSLTALAVAFAAPYLAWAFWTTARDGLNAFRARRDLPVLAKELCLDCKRGDGLPVLSGKIKRRRVSITPGYITVQVRQHPGFEAYHYRSTGPLPYRWVANLAGWLLSLRDSKDPEAKPEFSFGDARLDRFFSHRLAFGKTALIETVARSEPFRGALARFLERQQGQLSALTLGPELRFSPRVGTSGGPRSFSICARQVRAVLPDLLELAQAMETSAAKYLASE